MRHPGRSFAQRIDEDGTRYAKDEITLEELEDWIDLWLRAEDCDHCRNGQLCSGHYEQFYGGYWRPIPDTTEVVAR